MSSTPLLPNWIGEAETRPAEFRARFDRRAGGAGRVASRRVNRHRNRTLAACALALISLPAFATPDEWERFTIGSAGASELQVDPMPFEQAGSSFPGSAFYYLEADKFITGTAASKESIGTPLDPGPPALALHILDRPSLTSPNDRTRALRCMTSAIYYEAASEPDAGQRAVAQVVLNRVAHPNYPDTVCGVVFQGSELASGCQFSFTCDGSLGRKPAPYFWHRAETVAREALSGGVYRPVGLATHYHTLQVHPYWAPSLHTLTTIGAHRFYSFRGYEGQSTTFHFAYMGGEPFPAPHLRLTAAPTSNMPQPPVPNTADNQQGQARGNVDSVTAWTKHTLDRAAPGQTTNQDWNGGLQSPDKESHNRADTLPQTSGIRKEYVNSGRWLKKP